jgi:hypothetical protein
MRYHAESLNNIHRRPTRQREDHCNGLEREGSAVNGCNLDACDLDGCGPDECDKWM